MAKPIAQRRVPEVKENLTLPMLKVDEPELWKPPKGLLSTNRLSRVPNEYASDIKNLMLSEQTLRSRFGTSLFAGVPYPIIGIVGFTTPSQLGFFIRVSTTQLEVWDGVQWNLIFTGFTGSETDYWTFVNWGEELLMTNGVDKIFRYNPLTGEAGYLTESFPAKHIAMFGGRVIASGVVDGSYKPYRTRWCVKNENDDWTTDGSGFEDLFAAPGGQVDTLHGCFPVTDDTALMIRENTIWQMNTTGQLLTPFRFSLLTGKIGTKHRRAIAQVPGGYVVITHDNVDVIGLGQIQHIGEQVREELLPSITDPDMAVGHYDAARSEYRLAVGPVVWRYSFREQGWTKDQYPDDIRDITHVKYSRSSQTIDSQSGTIDSWPGAIDDPAFIIPVDNIMLLTRRAFDSVIAMEDETVTTDIDATIHDVNSDVFVATGLIQAGSVRDKSKVLECQIEYEAEMVQNLYIEYSTDAAVTWNPYSQLTVGFTPGPQIVAVRKTVTGHNIQLRVRSDTLGKLRILSFTPRVVQEAKVKP